MAEKKNDDFMKKFMADFAAKDSSEISASQPSPSQNISADSEEQKNEIGSLSDAAAFSATYMDSLTQQHEENREKRTAEMAEKKKRSSPVDAAEKISQLAKARAKAKKERAGGRQGGSAGPKPPRGTAPGRTDKSPVPGGKAVNPVPPWVLKEHAPTPPASPHINIGSVGQEKETAQPFDAATFSAAYMDGLTQRYREAKGRGMADIAGKEKLDITLAINRMVKARAKAKRERIRARQNGTAPQSPFKNLSPAPLFIRIKRGQSEIYMPTKRSGLSRYTKGKSITYDKFEAELIGHVRSDRELEKLTKQLYRKNTIEVSGFGKSFTIKYGKNKVREALDLSSSSSLSKAMIGNALKIDRAIVRNLKDGVKSLAAFETRHLAYQNEVTGTALTALKGSRIALRETKFALKTTAKITAKTAFHVTAGTINTGIAAYKVGKAAVYLYSHREQNAEWFADRVNGFRENIIDSIYNLKKTQNDIGNKIRKVQNDIKNAVDRLKKMTARQRREEIKKGINKVGGKIKNAAKEMAVKFLRFIFGLIKKALVPLLGGMLSVLFIVGPILLMLLAVLSLLSKDMPVYDCMVDYGAYFKIVAACEEYEDAWREAIEVQMLEKFTLPQPSPVCHYGNRNTIEVGYTCGTEHEEDAVKGLVIDPEDIFSLVCAYYDGDIHNLSASGGVNEYDPESPGEEEIMGFVQLILETYYPYDYIASGRIEIHQDIFRCYDYLSEADLGEGRERTEFIESCEKPLLYYPGDGIGDAGGGTHVFIHTLVTYHLEPFTYVLNRLADKEVLDRYRIYRSCFQSYFIASSDNSEGAPQGFLDNIHYFSDYDKLGMGEFWEASGSWSRLQLTRDDFAEMVKAHCDGSIPYSWGESSFSGSDCSGFVCLMFREAGFSLSGNTAWLWENSYAVDSTDAMPGDLVFKQAPTANGINHMGILYDNSDEEACLFMHCASGSGSVINGYDGFVMYRRLPVWFLDDAPASSVDDFNTSVN